MGSIDKNLIKIDKIDFSNIIRLFKKGNITKSYREMYVLAEELAIHETNRYIEILNARMNKGKINPKDYFNLTAKYRDKRLKYHLDYIKNLIEIHLESNK